LTPPAGADAGMSVPSVTGEASAAEDDDIGGGADDDAAGAGADGGIAAITTGAGFAGAAPNDVLDVGDDDDVSDLSCGSNRGALATVTVGADGASSRFGTSEPNPPPVSFSVPGNVGSKRPVLPNVDGVEDGKPDGSPKLLELG